MNHPMLKVVIFFAAGIWLDRYLPLPVWLWFVLSGLAAIGFLVCRRNGLYALSAFLVFCGATMHSVQNRPHLSSDLRRLELGEGWYVTLEGVLCSTPERKIFSHDELLQEITYATISAQKMAHDDAMLPVSGKVRIRTLSPLPDTFYKGVPVRVTGVLAQPPTPVSKSHFNYRNHLNLQQIHHVLHAEDAHAWSIIQEAGSIPERPWTDRFRHWAMNQMTLGLPEVDTSVKLQWAMILGWKTWLHGDMVDTFQRSGSMHLFAISGLHVAIVAGVFLGGTRLFQLPPLVSGWISGMGMWTYIAVSGWQTSAVRAGMMMSILLMGWMLKKPNTVVNSLFTAAWGILIWQPSQLFQIGFQLSFGVVLCLTVLANPIQRKLLDWTQPDPWIPRDRWTWYQRCWSGISRRMATGLSVSIAAWLGSAPIIWQHFHLVTPLGVIANLVLIPLGGFTICSAMGSLVCAGWAPALTELFNHSGWFWMQTMLYCSHWFADLEGSYFHVAPFSDAVLWSYYGLFILFALGGPILAWKRLATAGCVGLCLVLMGHHLLLTHQRHALTILPVVGGDSVWLDQPGFRHDMLVDGGNSSDMDKTTLPFLEAQGIDHLEEIWISHGDVNHIGGLETLMNRYPPQRMVAYPKGYRSQYFKKAVHLSEQKETQQLPGMLGISRGSVQVLYPPNAGNFPRADDAVLVLLIDMGDHRILYMGDLSREGMIQLSNRYPDLRADVLIINRPDEALPPNAHWLDQLDSRLILVSGVGYGRQKGKWVQILESYTFRSETRVWNTGATGSVQFIKEGPKLRIQPFIGKALILNTLYPEKGQGAIDPYWAFGSMISSEKGLVRKLLGFASG